MQKPKRPEQYWALHARLRVREGRPFLPVPEPAGHDKRLGTAFPADGKTPDRQRALLESLRVLTVRIEDDEAGIGRLGITVGV